MTWRTKWCVAGVTALNVMAAACAEKTSPLQSQVCFDADAQLARLTTPLESLRASGCTADDACGRLEREMARQALVCPAHAPTLVANASLAYEGRRLAVAQQYLDQALALPRPMPEAAALRARIALEEGNVPFARRLLERQLALTPGEATLHEAYAAVFYLSGQAALARRELDAATALGSPRWRIAYNLGLIEEGAGHVEEARRLYAEALQARPEWAPAASRLRGLRTQPPDGRR